MNPLKGLSVITPLVSLFIQQSPPPLPPHTPFHTPFTQTRSPAIIHPLTFQGINDNPILSFSLSLARTNTAKIREKGQVSPPYLSLSPPSSVRLAKSSINAHWTLENILRRRNKKPTGAKETEREKGTKEKEERRGTETSERERGGIGKEGGKKAVGDPTSGKILRKGGGTPGTFVAT